MRLGGLLLLLVWVLGHFALTLGLMNVTYRVWLPGRRWVMPTLLLIGLSGPALLIWHVAPRLAAGEGLGELDWRWRGYFMVAILFLIGGMALLLWQNTRPPPMAQLSNHRERFDLCAELGSMPIGHDALRLLCRLPMNQVFHVEVVTREIRFSRLPAAWEGLSILHLSDLHFHGTPGRDYYRWMAERCMSLKPDLIACTGDILDIHEVEEWLPATLGGVSAPLGCWFILGNHDARIDHARIRALMQRIGWKDLGGRWEMIEHLEHRMLLAGTEAPWLGVSPDLREAPAGDFRLLLAHTPHVRPWIRASGGDLALAGHLHGGQVQLPMLGPLVGGRYHSGLFEVGQTILHVSRGMGQIMPLRYFCRPEMTRIVLRG